jgi:GntR family transcriptional repressor for pyruvate dehydrogenase complex
MRDALQRMERGLRSAERYVGGDVHFHLAIAVATQNRIATHMMRAIREVLRRALMSIYHIPGSPERSLGHHREILDAVIAGRSEAARERMQAHLLQVEKDIDQTLRGVPGRPATYSARER